VRSEEYGAASTVEKHMISRLFEKFGVTDMLYGDVINMAAMTRDQLRPTLRRIFIFKFMTSSLLGHNHSVFKLATSVSLGVTFHNYATSFNGLTVWTC